MEAGIAQENHPLLELPNEPLKRVICHVRRGTVPRHHPAILVEHETEFPADNPAMIGEALAADLLRAAPFTDGMDELDTIRVNDAEYRRGGQQGLGPVLMGAEEATEPCPLGEAGEQGPIVARQPTIKRPIAPAFACMQEPERHHLTGPEACLRVFGDVVQVRIDLTEKSDDKIDRSHRILRARQGVTLPASLEDMPDYCNEVSLKLTLLVSIGCAPRPKRWSSS